MKAITTSNDSVPSSPEPEPQIWLDETLSEKDLRTKAALLHSWWLNVNARRDLTADQVFARPIVLEYLELRIGIVNGLLLAGSERNEDHEKRSADIEAEKRKVLDLVAADHFIDCIKAFGITEGHPLSPANLFPQKSTQATDQPPQRPIEVDLAKLLPHYTSPWKNAILLALLAKGINADYVAIGQYLTEHFPMVALPDYCAGHGRESLDYLTASVPGKAGKLIPRYPEINAAFQRDRTKVKRDLESYLEKLRDSLASEDARRLSH